MQVTKKMVKITMEAMTSPITETIAGQLIKHLVYKLHEKL